MQKGEGEYGGQNGSPSMQPPSPPQGALPPPPPGKVVIRPPKPPSSALPEAPPKALPEVPAFPPIPAAPESFRVPAAPLVFTRLSSGRRSNCARPQPAAMPSAQNAVASATARTKSEGQRLISPKHTTFFADISRRACSFRAQVLS